MRFPSAAATVTAVALFPASASAQPACAAAQFSAYAALGATGCTIGGVRVSAARVPLGVIATYAERAVFTPFMETLGDGRRLVGFDVTWSAPLSVPDPARPTVANLAAWMGAVDLHTDAGAFVGATVLDVRASFTQGVGTPAGAYWAEGAAVMYAVGSPGVGSGAARSATRRVGPGCMGLACPSFPMVDFTPAAAITGQFRGAVAGLREQDANGGVSMLSGMRAGFVIDPTAVVTVIPEPTPGVALALGVTTLVVGVRVRRRA